MVQQPVAEVQDQRTVPPDEHLEGHFIVVGDEPFEQLGVREAAAAIGTDGPAKAFEEQAQLAGRHRGRSPVVLAKSASSYHI